MHVETIILSNFQAHKDLRLALSPITSIVGPSDIGKSAILRALRWCCLNDFAGDDFITWGEKETFVHLLIREQKKVFQIIRTKSARHNAYALDKEEFKAVGTGVPDRISNLLRLSEINFQGQFDSPFWFSESAPEISRQLNRVIDLSVIDTSLSFIASAVRSASERVALLTERLEGWRREQNELEPQRARAAQFRALEKLEQKQNEAEENHDHLFTLLARIDSNSAGELQEQAEDALALFGTARGWRNLSLDVEALQSILGRIDNLGTWAEPPDFSGVETARAVLIQKSYFCASLEKLVEAITEADNNCVDLHETFLACEEKFHREIQNQICPLCGKKL